MSQLKLLLQVALRNLFTSWVNIIIGGIIFFGTLLVVVGGALLDSMDESMSRSIIGSVAGHLQVYSDKSKDELALFGQMGGEADVSAVDDFSRIKQLAEKHPNVQTVVPMGISGALMMSGNLVDMTLAQLRDLYKKQAAQGETPELRAQIDSIKAHVRHMIALLEEDLKRRGEVADEASVDPQDVEALALTRSEAFWADFEKAPLDSLEFLENRIAPQMADGVMIYLRYVGTDLVHYQKTFDRVRIVEGESVPAGQRGLLLSKLFYEENFKLKMARRLDLIKEDRELNGKMIATDPTLKRRVKDNQTQTREILFQLDPYKMKLATERLQRILGKPEEKDLEKLLVSFLTMDDANFDTRYQQFYSELAPLLALYRVRIGDDLTITAYTRTGYMQSVNVKIYGTYNFEGLEKSALAGSLNLMDLMTFRELYGYLTADKKAELAKLQETSGVDHVKREDAESALFGEESGTTLVANATPGLIDEDAQLDPKAQALRREELKKRVYSQEELENGVVLSSALMLKDPTKLEQTRDELQAAATQAGLPLKVISWQKASGMIGQFVLFAKLVLYIAVLIIFVVALAIINNAMMMATMQRVREVGTMRAIGAQRSFVLSMVLLETVVLGLLFGTLGALAGGGIVKTLGKVGIPAGNEALYFFFSGPRLFPNLYMSNLVAAFIIVLVVSALSTFYPAFLATRVSPIKAMQSDE